MRNTIPRIFYIIPICFLISSFIRVYIQSEKIFLDFSDVSLNGRRQYFGPSFYYSILIDLLLSCRAREGREGREREGREGRERGRGRGERKKEWKRLLLLLYVPSPTSQLILQPFRRFTYVTAHSPTLPLLHLRHRLFSNPSFASPTSQALHLRHLASRP